MSARIANIEKAIEDIAKAINIGANLAEGKLRENELYGDEVSVLEWFLERMSVVDRDHNLPRLYVEISRHAEDAYKSGELSRNELDAFYDRLSEIMNTSIEVYCRLSDLQNRSNRLYFDSRRDNSSIFGRRSGSIFGRNQDSGGIRTQNLASLVNRDTRSLSSLFNRDTTTNLIQSSAMGKKKVVSSGNAIRPLEEARSTLRDLISNTRQERQERATPFTIKESPAPKEETKAKAPPPPALPDLSFNTSKVVDDEYFQKNYDHIALPMVIDPDLGLNVKNCFYKTIFFNAVEEENYDKVISTPKVTPYEETDKVIEMEENTPFITTEQLLTTASEIKEGSVIEGVGPLAVETIFAQGNAEDILRSVEILNLYFKDTVGQDEKNSYMQPTKINTFLKEISSVPVLLDYFLKKARKHIYLGITSCNGIEEERQKLIIEDGDNLEKKTDVLKRYMDWLTINSKLLKQLKDSPYLKHFEKGMSSYKEALSRVMIVGEKINDKVVKLTITERSRIVYIQDSELAKQLNDIRDGGVGLTQRTNPKLFVVLKKRLEQEHRNGIKHSINLMTVYGKRYELVTMGERYFLLDGTS